MRSGHPVLLLSGCRRGMLGHKEVWAEELKGTLEVPEGKKAVYIVLSVTTGHSEQGNSWDRTAKT